MTAKLTPPQVAKIYGVKADTVIKWIRSGELPAIDVSRRGSSRPRFRIDETALHEFESRRSVRPARKKIASRKMSGAMTRFY
jgi:excisionase family DNA binding protein